MSQTQDAIVTTEGCVEHIHYFNIGDEIEVTKEKTIMGMFYAARRKSDGKVQGLKSEDFKPINSVEY